MDENQVEGGPLVLSLDSPSHADLTPAISALSQGQLIVFPTDTVYGIGTNPTFELSIHRLYKAKRRNKSLPLTLHAADRQQALDYVSQFSPQAEALADLFWPGPLTLILPRSEKVPASMVGGLNSVGVRVPDHDVVRAIAYESGVPIAGTSANLSGATTGTNMRHAMDDFGATVDVYLDCGATQGGIESTVLDLTQDKPRIIRPGMISGHQISETLAAEGLGADVEENVGQWPSKLTVHPGPRLVAVVGASEWAVRMACRLAEEASAVGPVWLLMSPLAAQHYGYLQPGAQEGKYVIKHVSADSFYEILREAESRQVGQVVCAGANAPEDALLVDRMARRASTLVTENGKGPEA